MFSFKFINLHILNHGFVNHIWCIISAVGWASYSELQSAPQAWKQRKQKKNYRISLLDDFYIAQKWHQKINQTSRNILMSHTVSLRKVLVFSKLTWDVRQVSLLLFRKIDFRNRSERYLAMLQVHNYRHFKDKKQGILSNFA